MEILQRMPFKARKSVFEELEKIADISALSKEDQEKYEELIKVYRDNLATEQWAIEKGRKEGLEKGIQIGQERGIQIGRKEGIQKGMQDGLLLTARGMKAKGYPLEDIAQITGLSMEVINRL